MAGLAAGLVWTSSATAEPEIQTVEPEGIVPIASPSTPPAEGRVSMSPEHAGPDTALVSLPLTRAASQQKIDAMSPLDWLSSYGRVLVSRTR